MVMFEPQTDGRRLLNPFFLLPFHFSVAPIAKPRAGRLSNLVGVEAVTIGQVDVAAVVRQVPESVVRRFYFAHEPRVLVTRDEVRTCFRKDEFYFGLAFLHAEELVVYQDVGVRRHRDIRSDPELGTALQSCFGREAPTPPVASLGNGDDRDVRFRLREGPLLRLAAGEGAMSRSMAIFMAAYLALRRPR